MIKVITDSTADLSAAQVTQYGLSVVPLYVLFGGEMHRDGVDITTSELFKGMQAGQKIPSTSQPSPAEFAAAYQSALQEADEVLSVHIGSGLSGTVSSARLAAQDFGGKVSVVDGQTTSMGLGLQAIRAAERVAQGHGVPDIVAELERLQARMTLRFTVESLEFLRLNGRIGGATALLGGLLSIKPILTMQDSKVTSAGRERGQKKATANIVDYARAYAAKQGRSRFVFMTTPGGEANAAELRAALQGVDFEDMGDGVFGSVVATHIGPGSYGIVMEPVEV